MATIIDGQILDDGVDPQPEDVEEERDHQEWIDSLAKECTCCNTCCDVPCEALMAGAPCDNYPCTCNED